MRRVIFFLILITLLTGLAGCEGEEEKKEGETNVLVGMWEEKAPYHDGDCDTIVFNENGTIGKYFEYPVVYSVSDDLIFFKYDETSQGWPCGFTIIGDTLTIQNFSYIFSPASVIGEDVEFTKIQ